VNPYSEEGWKFCEASLVSLCKNGGAKLIRLDAFGYVTKKAGTDCFMEVSVVATMLQFASTGCRLAHAYQCHCQPDGTAQMNCQVAQLTWCKTWRTS
jgi:sucrose phosphorylase